MKNGMIGKLSFIGSPVVMGGGAFAWKAFDMPSVLAASCENGWIIVSCRAVAADLTTELCVWRYSAEEKKSVKDSVLGAAEFVKSCAEKDKSCLFIPEFEPLEGI